MTKGSTKGLKASIVNTDPSFTETDGGHSESSSDESSSTATPQPAGDMTQFLQLMNAMEVRRDNAMRREKDLVDARAREREELREKREEERRRLDEECWMTMFQASQAAANQNLVIFQTAEETRRCERLEDVARKEQQHREDAERAAKQREEDAERAVARDRKRAGKDVPKLASLVDVEDLDSFLNTFDAQMQLYEVYTDYWLANLLLLLDPTSLRFQEKMPMSTKNDFEAV